jgi:hypothetical protein
MNLKRAFLWLLGGLMFASLTAAPAQTNLPTALSGKVYILPIREDIMPPLVYVVRRGVKEAMEANADALILDMNTDGGRVDITEEIIQHHQQVQGPDRYLRQRPRVLCRRIYLRGDAKNLHGPAKCHRRRRAHHDVSRRQAARKRCPTPSKPK